MRIDNSIPAGFTAEEYEEILAEVYQQCYSCEEEVTQDVEGN